MLLLDEPSSGLNTDETLGLGAVLEQLASEGMGVLLVEHDMTLVMAICARVDVLDNGFVIARGDPATVQAHPVVQEAYLGGGAALVRPPAGGSGGGDGRCPASKGAGGDVAPALSAVDVRAGYGRIEVLHGISLACGRVRPGAARAGRRRQDDPAQSDLGAARADGRVRSK